MRGSNSESRSEPERRQINGWTVAPSDATGISDLGIIKVVYERFVVIYPIYNEIDSGLLQNYQLINIYLITMNIYFRNRSENLSMRGKYSLQNFLNNTAINFIIIEISWLITDIKFKNA